MSMQIIWDCLKELERRMSAVEQRLGLGAQHRPRTPSAQEKERTRSLTTIRPERTSTLQRVIELHRRGLKQNQIAQKLGIHKSNVSRAIKKAKEKGRLTQQVHKKEVATCAPLGSPLRNWFKYQRNF